MKTLKITKMVKKKKKEITSSDVYHYEVEFIPVFKQSFLILGDLYRWLLTLPLVFRL